ncbi:MAG TPA: serine hydrolase [Thermoanaerobaculia bacterium]|nr:serine hydrolase [Thermoanaerobaculia bacterium]
MRLAIALLLLSSSASAASRFARFEKEADAFRRQLGIPGMSAVIIEKQKIVWMKGFGFADLENKVPATPDTLYHVASLTKTFAAVLVLQLVEQGKLDLDEPVSRYSKEITDERVKIRHIISHTSEGTMPGDAYAYSGNRFDALTALIEAKYGKPFRQVMIETFLVPLKMTASVPGHDVENDPALAPRYAKQLERFAKPYVLYGAGEIVRDSYPPRDMNAAAGLLSTVRDLAKYDVAIDRHVLLKPETLARAWTPFLSNAGKPLPHGLGWFVQDHRGVKLVWHFGNWGHGFSATYLKVPEKQLTLILLANSEGLSNGFYNDGRIESNPIACAFLRTLVVHGEDACTAVAAEAVRTRLARLAANARKAVTVDAKVLEDYVGSYERTDITHTHVVTREGNHLFIDIGGRSEMFAESDSQFFFKNRTYLARFIRDAAGKVITLEFEEDGQKVTAKRTR